MKGMHQILEEMREQDPGALRFRRALRTCLAILITQSLLYGVKRLWPSWFSTEACLAGFIAALMAGVSTRGDRLGEKAISYLLAGTSCLVMLGLAFLTRHHHALQSLLLLAICFSSFYFRRFGPAAISTGLSSLIFFIIASIVAPACPSMAPMMVATATAFFVVALLHLSLLNENMDQAFLDGERKSLRLAWAAVRTMASLLRQEEQAGESLQSALRDLQKAGDSARALATRNPVARRFEQRWITLYRLQGAIGMAAEALLELRGTLDREESLSVAALLMDWSTTLPILGEEFPCPAFQERIETLSAMHYKQLPDPIQALFPILRFYFALNRMGTLALEWSREAGGPSCSA